MWTEALNLAEVRASLDLWKIENIFYPPTLQIASPQTSQTDTIPKISMTVQSVGNVSTIASTTAKTSTPTQPAGMGATKATSAPTQALKEKEVSQGKEIATKTTLEPSKAQNEKEVSKGKEAEHSEPPPTNKANPPPFTGIQDFFFSLERKMTKSVTYFPCFSKGKF